MRRRTSCLRSLGALGCLVVTLGCAGSSTSQGDGSNGSHGALAGRASFAGGASGTNLGGAAASSAGANGVGLGGAGAAAFGVVGSGGAASVSSGGFAGHTVAGRSSSSAGGAGGTLSTSGSGGSGDAAVAGVGGVAGAPANTAGSGSDDSSAGGVPATTRPATWDTIKLVLSGTRPPCNSSICHGGNGKVSLGFPVDNDDQLYAVLTQFVATDCGNMALVVPNHPEESALVKAIKGPCSDQIPRMPDGCTDADGNCVPDDYIAAVEQWITNGAMRP